MDVNGKAVKVYKKIGNTNEKILFQFLHGIFGECLSLNLKLRTLCRRDTKAWAPLFSRQQEAIWQVLLSNQSKRQGKNTHICTFQAF